MSREKLKGSFRLKAHGLGFFCLVLLAMAGNSWASCRVQGGETYNITYTSTPPFCYGDVFPENPPLPTFCPGGWCGCAGQYYYDEGMINGDCGLRNVETCVTFNSCTGGTTNPITYYRRVKCRYSCDTQEEAEKNATAYCSANPSAVGCLPKEICTPNKLYVDNECKEETNNFITCIGNECSTNEDVNAHIWKITAKQCNAQGTGYINQTYSESPTYSGGCTNAQTSEAEKALGQCYNKNYAGQTWAIFKYNGNITAQVENANCNSVGFAAAKEQENLKPVVSQDTIISDGDTIITQNCDNGASTCFEWQVQFINGQTAIVTDINGNVARCKTDDFGRVDWSQCNFNMSIENFGGSSSSAAGSSASSVDLSGVESLLASIDGNTAQTAAGVGVLLAPVQQTAANTAATAQAANTAAQAAQAAAEEQAKTTTAIQNNTNAITNKLEVVKDGFILAVSSASQSNVISLNLINESILSASSAASAESNQTQDKINSFDSSFVVFAAKQNAANESFTNFQLWQKEQFPIILDSLLQKNKDTNTIIVDVPPIGSSSSIDSLVYDVGDTNYNFLQSWTDLFNSSTAPIDSILNDTTQSVDKTLDSMAQATLSGFDSINGNALLDSAKKRAGVIDSMFKGYNYKQIGSYSSGCPAFLQEKKQICLLSNNKVCFKFNYEFLCQNHFWGHDLFYWGRVILAFFVGLWCWWVMYRKILGLNQQYME